MRTRVLSAAVAGVLLLGLGAQSSLAAETPRGLYKKLAKAGVCTAFDPDPDAELFVREQGSCTSRADRDSSLWIYTFSGGGQKQWLGFVDSMGGGPMVVGKNWVITTDTSSDAKRVKRALGGKLA